MKSGKEYTGWGLQEDWKERQWTLDRAKNALYLFMELLKDKIFESSSLFCDVYAWWQFRSLGTDVTKFLEMG